MQPAVFDPVPLDEYALVDSGAAQKLERFGPRTLRRPDPQALWPRALPAAEWERADLCFVRESDRGGRWEPRTQGVPAEWTIEVGRGRFRIRPTPFKHVGIFPEQAPNWKLVAEVRAHFALERPRLLNLFGYSGVASVLAALEGYEVVHVDASKAAITWTRENAELSGLAADALRVIIDDALSFARREARRGSRYQVILLDPPHFGRGPKGETWQFEDHAAALIESVRELVAERALVVFSTYAIGCSPLALVNLLALLGPGASEGGELVLTPAGPGPVLPAGFCARWSRGLERR